jgi:hypothetical protein
VDDGAATEEEETDIFPDCPKLANVFDFIEASFHQARLI